MQTQRTSENIIRHYTFESDSYDLDIIRIIFYQSVCVCVRRVSNTEQLKLTYEQVRVQINFLALIILYTRERMHFSSIQQTHNQKQRFKYQRSVYTYTRQHKIYKFHCDSKVSKCIHRACIYMCVVSTRINDYLLYLNRIRNKI